AWPASAAPALQGPARAVLAAADNRGTAAAAADSTGTAVAALGSFPDTDSPVAARARPPEPPGSKRRRANAFSYLHRRLRFWTSTRVSATVKITIQGVDTGAPPTRQPQPGVARVPSSSGVPKLPVFARS